MRVGSNQIKSEYRVVSGVIGFRLGLPSLYGQLVKGDLGLVGIQN